ncbi:hypothetical protein [Paenibacillus sp. UNC451MF]|uniref:hypothetical protein n=1 Tax=Paenibacillus sp. UNC451MF TaxID=1449063 RepID=UPI0012DE0E18|nr:hypothetical protein [Paenibacillus sp. UNC451MF]
MAGWVKTIIDFGWYLTNSNAGMPFGQEMYDYAGSDMFNFFLIKAMSWFTDKFGLIMNLFFLLGFPLCACAAAFVTRYLKLSYMSAFVTGILFTMLPFHFFRNATHMFLGFYWTIPFIVLMIYWSSTIERPSRKMYIWSIILSLIISSSGVYYAFFGCFLLVSIGIIAIIKRRSIKLSLYPFVITLVIAVGCLINLSPNFTYSLTHGKNIETSHKFYGEAEAYGLKITQLVLPVNDHRIDKLAELKSKYNLNFPISYGSAHTALGIVGTIGFIILLFSLLSPMKEDLINKMGKINILSLLLSTIGGIGAIISFVVPEIRGYDRIGLFIAFVSFIGFFSLLERMKVKSTAARSIVFLIVLVIGMLDQTTNSFAVNYKVQDEYKSDQKFVQNIESSVPQNSMIFQLPYVAYPESPRVEKMADYALSKGYLHSNSLRWSYGAMRGRYGDQWQKLVSQKPMPEMVNHLIYAGFQGIYIDRFGYKDNGEKIESELQNILHVTPIISDDQRLTYFDFGSYEKTLNIPHNELEKLKNKAMYLVNDTWSNGFYGLEKDLTHNWRWSSSEGDLFLTNPAPSAKQLTISLGLSTGYPNKSKVFLTGLINESFEVNNQTAFFNKSITLPPGMHQIHFSTNAKRLDGSDPRELFFNVVDWKITEN